MTSIAYPYLRPPDETVLASDWVILEQGVPVEAVGGQLPHFDYSSELTVSRQLSFQIPQLAASIGLDPQQLRLLCLVSAGTGGSRLDRLRQTVFREEVSADHPSISIELPLDSRSISRSVSLVTELVFLSSSNEQGQLSPRIEGSRLWRDVFSVDVEPFAARFPMEAVSFRAMLPEGPADALWFLEWSPREMDHEFGSAVRLYINQDVPEFVDGIHRADEVVLRMLMAAVAVQMIRAALASDHFDPAAGVHPETSVGAVIDDWIARSFPGQTLDSVRTLAEYDPARFEAAVASLTSGQLDG